MFFLGLLIATTKAVVIQGLDTASLEIEYKAQYEYMRRYGAPFLELQTQQPPGYVYTLFPDVASMVIESAEAEKLKRELPVGFNKEYRAILSDEVALVPKEYPPGMEITEKLLALCPDLKKMVITNRSTKDKVIYEVREYYPEYEDEPRVLREVFYVAPTEYYCGANFPLQEVSIQVPGVGEQKVYPMALDEVPVEAASKVLGYIWKINVFDGEKAKELPKMITKSNAVFFRLLSSMSKVYHHSYSLNVTEVQEKLANNMFFEHPLGLVISMELERSNEMNGLCPDLVKASLFRKGNINYITTIDECCGPDGYQLVDTFYCAPYAGYCGATHKLQRLISKAKDDDNLFTTDKSEAESVYANNPKYQPNFKPQTVCYVWTPNQQTLVSEFSSIASKVKAVDWKIARGYWKTGPNKGVKTFSTDKVKYDALVASGDVHKAFDLGYVAKGSSELLRICPQLLNLKIYQEKGGNQRTFIGANAKPTPVTKGQWVLEREFLCAPYQGYCGADTLLWGLQNWNPYYSIMYTVDRNEVVKYSVGSNFPYRLCYIWGV